MQVGNWRTQKIHWIALGALFLAGCAAGDERFLTEDPAGFWAGIWHGLIAPITFLVGLFYDSVEIYERTNNGGWYDLGFLIGMSICGKGGSSSHRKWRAVKVDRAKVRTHRRRAHVDVDISWDEEEGAEDPLDDSP